MGGNVRRANSTRRNAVRARVRAQGASCWICGLDIDYNRPARDPLAYEADELVPVSQGGSPYDADNIRAAHRCCNAWRSAKSVAKVEKLKAAAIARGAAWQTPIDFVNIMRATQSHAIDTETLLQYKHTTTW